MTKSILLLVAACACVGCASYPDTSPLRKRARNKPEPVRDPPAAAEVFIEPRFEPKRAPISEQPKVEQPKVEQPKVEQPKVEQPKVEQPKVNQPKVEQPKVNQSKPDLDQFFT